jgi:uncharacterized protein YaiE (UPF0345 family)
MRITNNGNVGIGTTTSAWSLGKTLQIGGDNGAINFSGTSAILGIVNAYYNGSSYIHQNTGTVASFEYGLASANAFNWRMSPSANAGSTAPLGIVMSLTNAGNLGIGTPSPANTLHVAGIGRIDTGLYFVNGGTGGAFVWNIANESLRFGTNDTERMRITSGGLVAIGNTSPLGNGASAVLDIGNGSGGTLNLRDTNTGIASEGFHQIYGGDNRMYFYAGGSGASAYMQFYTNDAERMRITSGGQVLMGTTSAQSGTRLQVAGVLDVWSSANTLLRLNHDGTRGVIETFTGGGYSNTVINPNGGNVGIGTTVEAGRLNINSTNSGGDSTALSLMNRGTANNTAVQISFRGLTAGGSENDYGYIKMVQTNTSTPASELSFWTQSGSVAERMRITSAGEVWMGYTSDQGAYLLQVNGAVFASSYFESSDTRLKNITNTYNGLDFGAIQYTWKDGRDAKLHWGYAAQDVMKYIPDAVNENKDGFLSLDYNQAHTYKIAMLENRIAELEKQLNNK